ncbi:MAG: hypothetical protein COB67_04370 [SAR324 cluster bacterium]|uniref:Uncharacterized protein n=1 Tax=SAR324 cluster bacterium TaxID=2024889 RepID=A0A2A4T7I4_9DELT|nr:MAG: hypothetical protein COB67_04370 [SAR324 cluster bacterium]
MKDWWPKVWDIPFKASSADLSSFITDPEVLSVPPLCCQKANLIVAFLRDRSEQTPAFLPFPKVFIQTISGSSFFNFKNS